MGYLPLLIFLLLRSTVIESRWRPCIEIKRELRIPCECAVTVSGLMKNILSVEVNCDHIILAHDALLRLDDQAIISFSQKFCGYQNLPVQVMKILPNSVESLDLSHNAIHRLTDRLFQGRKHLKELKLSNNALGDNLNPIFSSNEFHEFSNLKLLDLRFNGLRSIEEGIFKGCDNLEELYLDFNNLTKPPIESLKGPNALKILSLAGNNIDSIDYGAFSTLGQTLLNLNLSSNELFHIEDGAFIGLKNLLALNISHNYINYLNSDAFKGIHNLQQLDISTNFLDNFPTEALRYQKNLKFLNISNNLITDLERAQLVDLKNLQILDVSYNNIGRLGTNAFTDLTFLSRLDLSFNALRAIDDSSFEGLNNLKWLSLKDNNIVLMPSAALNKLPRLNQLHLEFNRIAVITSENLDATAPHLTTLSLTRNLIRELPPRFFFHFDRLASIELSGNMISVVDPQSFIGVEDTVIHLDLSYNKLSVLEEMPLYNLSSLNLAGNLLNKISPDVFKQLRKLQYLNISDNPLYGGFPPIFSRTLTKLDVARTGLQVLPSVLLLNLENLESASFSGNKIQELGEATFKNHFNLTSVDLSYNEIRVIRNGAFMGLHNLRYLYVGGNKLQSFTGEYFNTGTGLEFLDLSDNLLDYLSPTGFLIHPRLRTIDLSNNRLTVFANELVKSLQYLEYLNLSNNRLSIIGEFAFAQVAYLRELNLSYNRIEYVDELAFHNSSQLQNLDLSGNRLENLNERMMEGVQRIENLNLKGNRLRSLPDTIFDPMRIRTLEKIDLSDNHFAEIPVQALQKQAVNLIDLNIARNGLSEILTQDIIISVQYLDLSENTLSENAIKGIFNEAKVLRSLNIAFCGIYKVLKLEAPFLRYLNLSGNHLEYIEPFALERTTMLEVLDISRNKIKSLYNILEAFGSFSTLKSLDISNNDIRIINESSFIGFNSLRTLKMFELPNCTRIEKNAFKFLFKLQSLEAFNFPRLGYFDIQGVIKNMNKLESLDVEVKDLSIGGDQLSITRKHPHLKTIILRGERLRNAVSNLLVGIKQPYLTLGFKNTSIDSLPAGLLFPVPRSTHMELNINGSKFKTVSSQILSAFEERNGFIKVKGLKISIDCNCQVKSLWKWYKLSTNQLDNFITCSSPKSLVGQSLANLTEEKLFCEPDKKTVVRLSTTELNVSNSDQNSPSTSSEPEIIWTVAPTFQDSRNIQQVRDKSSTNVSGFTSSIDDTIIIGIIGGVAVFIIIIIIVIIVCICRLRYGSTTNEARIRAVVTSGNYDTSMLRSPSTYSGNCGKLNQDLYVNSYNSSTLGHQNNAMIAPNSSMSATPVQVLPLVQPLSILHSSSGTQPIYGYYDNSPIYITSSENKFDK